MGLVGRSDEDFDKSSKLRAFDHPNMSSGFVCPVCKTSADKPVVLAPIPGTEEDGLMQCMQIHEKCYNLVVEMNS